MTVQAAPPHRPRPARSTAAQRAYQRRSERAAHLGVEPADTRGRTTGAGRVRTRIPFVAGIIALLGVGMAVTLLLTTRATEDSYQLSAARAHNESLLQQRAVLQRDVAAGNSAPSLARAAGEQGMIPSGQVARLVVAEDGSVRVVGEPVPAEGAPPAPLSPPRPREEGRVQTPLAGSAGAENPRPLGSSGEEPTPRDSGVADRRAAAAAAEQPVAPASAPAGEPAPVSELPQPEAPRSIAPEGAPGQEQPTDAEGRR